MLTIIEKVVFLQDIPAFAEVPTEQLSHIASITEEIELEPGAVLIRQDEPAEALYFIVNGKLRFDLNGREIMEVGEKNPSAPGLYSTMNCRICSRQLPLSQRDC